MKLSAFFGWVALILLFFTDSPWWILFLILWLLRVGDDYYLGYRKYEEPSEGSEGT